jgi:hypothetical protein
MKRKVTVLTLCATLFAFCFPAAAQQSTKVPRVGYLAFSIPPTNPLRANAFRQGLRQVRYTEGEKTLSLSIAMRRGN